MPWGSLLLGTLVYEIGVGIGLLFLVVPGFIVATWGVVTGPVVVAEGTRALKAPGRSRELVRGSFRPVALFVLLAFVVSETISSVAGALLDLLPQTWAEPTGEYVVHVLTSPLFGMATAVLYYALRGTRTGPGARRARRSGPASVKLWVWPQASRTFLATAIPIAARMRMMSSFFMVSPWSTLRARRLRAS